MLLTTEVAITEKPEEKSETTPNILYYQCSSHGYMGSRIDIQSSTSVIDSSTAFVDSTGTAITFASTAFSIAQAVALG